MATDWHSNNGKITSLSFENENEKITIELGIKLDDQDQSINVIDIRLSRFIPDEDEYDDGGDYEDFLLEIPDDKKKVLAKYFQQVADMLTGKKFDPYKSY